MKLKFALTDTTLRHVKSREKPYKLTDGGGLYLLVNPNGSMLWRYKYTFEGKEKLLSLGQYPAVKLAAARKAHQDAKIKLQGGTDPAAARQAEQQAAEAQAALREKTFSKAADEWLDTRKPPEGKKSKRYDRDARMVRYLKEGKGIAPGFAKATMDQIELGHLLPLLKAVNHPTRIRLISAARKIISCAKAHGMWPKDRPSPFADIDFEAGFAKHKEKHRPAITDPVKFGHLLRKIEIYEGRGDNLTGHALELLALTFVRPGTIATAKWAHFDLKKALWVVPFEGLKMATERSEAGKSVDDYIVPLSRQAVALLRELHKITGDGEYLFPGRGDGRTISENTLNYALHGLGYKGSHCAHGFRSTASTLLNRERVNGRRRFERELIEMQQDRLDASTRAVYDRDDRLPERIELMQFWADKIDVLRENVVRDGHGVKIVADWRA
ncbi:tyrosine-type recombinase/integrase [Bradyrhizobium australiense]|uniref:Integrase arm-type DNA-binding domain-containing protein n=1 Tax=Bradyrhizobium australiense TaxID=2721161 RepID=A0A7Y4GRB9_9BRAD|nr:site-specific integrase [Bradyrhizobium australiense]NOJ40312.1 integrase arm-type DNA-binding domain-containing protein [Bradyrhizobium australiense]